MLTTLDSLFGRIGKQSRDISWTLFRLLTASMFMTHGFAKLFGDSPQPFTGGGMTSINIGDVISLPIPGAINALFIAGIIEFFGGLCVFLRFKTHLAAFMTMLLMLMAYLTWRTSGPVFRGLHGNSGDRSQPLQRRQLAKKTR
jgi:uncharacterized membrane protein YphA (DoxX/SURF4 family)